MPLLVDSHAHLDLLEDADASLASARESGVRWIVAVGIDLKSSARAVKYANDNEDVLASVGIHPHDASGVDAQSLAELKSLAASCNRVVAIGETGLDYYRDRSPREHQKTAFIQQIGLAREYNLPLIVHSREASSDALAVLEEHASGLKVIMHCFSLYEHVELCAERGYFMSLAGNVTFTKAAALREAAARIPDRLLLTETDCPYLTPVPHRGAPNNPANVRFILDEVASLRGVGPETLAAQVHKNFTSVFSLPPGA